jgi:hypothetical protein
MQSRKNRSKANDVFEKMRTMIDCQCANVLKAKDLLTMLAVSMPARQACGRTLQQVSGS